MKKSARISACKKYRYTLSRVWKSEGLIFAFFGVNPSTADASLDDQTVKKWIGFTERNGGRGFIAGNPFAYRATDVKELAAVEDPVGRYNPMNLRIVIERADILVPCWGNTSKVPGYMRHHFPALLVDLFESGKPVKIFGRTKSGDPKHPLMLGYDTKLINYQIPEV
jgi:hypothetical protein